MTYKLFFTFKRLSDLSLKGLVNHAFWGAFFGKYVWNFFFSGEIKQVLEKTLSEIDFKMKMLKQQYFDFRVSSTFCAAQEGGWIAIPRSVQEIFWWCCT